MRKFISLILIFLTLGYGFGLFRDLDVLHSQVIRLHVVGATNEKADQEVKLKVKDAVNQYLVQSLHNVDSIEETKTKLLELIPEIEAVAEEVLRENGFSDPVQISFEKESFPRREYDTFSLPAGVYDSLRIRIGQAEGMNWWCVVFPTLCLPAEEEELRDVAAGAGFSEALSNTLIEEDGYEIRFFFLDLLGQFQNFLFEQ